MRTGELLDSRRQRNQVHFVRVAEEMRCLGYTWTWQQLRTHWKNLKGKYNIESELQKLRGAAPSKWRWYTEVSAILSHRPMAQAQEYGADSDAVSEPQNSQTPESSDADEWQPESEGRSQSPYDATQSNDRSSGHSLQGSSTSSNDLTGSAPPAKRPRRGKLTELAELMQEQHSRNADMLMEYTQLMLDQKKELTKESNDSFKATMTGITALFLQGTQSMLAQLISQPPQAFGQPSPAFTIPPVFQNPTWAFGQVPSQYNQPAQRSNATASRRAPVIGQSEEALNPLSVQGYPGVATNMEVSSDTHTGKDQPEHIFL